MHAASLFCCQGAQMHDSDQRKEGRKQISRRTPCIKCEICEVALYDNVYFTRFLYTIVLRVFIARVCASLRKATFVVEKNQPTNTHTQKKKESTKSIEKWKKEEGKNDRTWNAIPA